MKVEPFLLDRWLEKKSRAEPRIEHDLGSSTGPHWSANDLLALATAAERDELLHTGLYYSDAAGDVDLRREIAVAEGTSIESVLVVAGASEGLHLLLVDAATDHANVVLPHPVFPPAEVLARALGLEVRRYVLRSENGFEVDLGEVGRLVDGRTTLLYANSPHNPTGAVLDDVSVRSLHDVAADRGAVFVLDQVYHPIYHGKPGGTAVRLPNATTLGSLSKANCLSGLRLGWIVEHDADRRSRLVELRSYFTISNSPLTEKLGILGLRYRDTILRRARVAAERNLRVLDEYFGHHRRCRWVRPSGGFTAFPSFVDGTNARVLCHELLQRGVLIVPGDCFGELSHFRVGFGATEAGFADALAIFAEVVERAA